MEGAVGETRLSTPLARFKEILMGYHAVLEAHLLPIAEIRTLAEDLRSSFSPQDIAKAFSEVADQFADHDYPYIDDDSTPLCVEEINAKNRSWQIWYICKIFAGHFGHQLTLDDQALGDKSSTLLEVFVPPENPDYNRVSRNAKRFYSQQLQIRDTIVSGFNDIDINPSSVLPELSAFGVDC